MRTAIYQVVGLAGMFALGMLCGVALRSSAGRARQAYVAGVPRIGIDVGRRWRRLGLAAHGHAAGPAEAGSDIDSRDTYAASDEVEDAG